MADEYGLTPDIKLTADELNQRHQYGASLFSEWRGHALEQELVWKGDFDTKRLRSDVYYPRPSEGRSLLKKMDEMLAIRSKKKIAVLPRDGAGDTDREQLAVDRLETFLKGWMRCHREETGQDFIRAAERMTMLYGRGPMHVVYVPEYGPRLPVQVRVYDPLTTYPVRGQRGFTWLTREVFMSGYDLQQYFAGLPDEFRTHVQGSLDAHTTSLRGLHRMIEYWDNTHCAWSIGSSLVDAYEHGYGCLTYREMRLNEMPVANERWASEGFLGMVMDSIKAKAMMRGRLLTANETSYFDDLYMVNEDGGLYKVDHNMPPGEFKELPPGFKPVTVKKDVNHALWQTLYQALSGEINEATLSKLAFALDLPNVSGFATSQVLSIIRDAIADAIDQMEQVTGGTMGDVLRVHERFAPEEGWRYSTSTRKGQGAVRASDIDGRYEVVVTIRGAVPQDRLSKVTELRQMVAPDPATGLPIFPPKHAMKVVELDDEIENWSEMEAELEQLELIALDPSAKQLRAAYLRAKHADTLHDWEKLVEQQARKDEERATRETGKAIERGMSQDALLPADMKNPQVLHQVASLMDQGQTFEQALAAVQGGLPRGAPGEPVAAGGQQLVMPEGTPPEMAQLMQGLFGGKAPPDGLTGYDNGMSPEVAPAAMQGGLPRQSVDQPALQVEDMEEQMRRGALPPPR